MKRYMAQVKNSFYTIDVWANSKKEALNILRHDYGFIVKSIWVTI